MLKYALSLKDEGFIFLSISPGLVDTFEGRPGMCASACRGNIILKRVLQATPETQAEYMKLFDKFKTVYPDSVGSVTPEVGVRQMLDVFSQLKPEHNGNFCSHFGPTSKKWL